MLKINGQPVHSLAHLAQAITAVEKAAGSVSTGSSGSSPGSREYMRLDLEWSKVVVMDVGRAAAATGRILRQNNIPAAASDGLMEQVGGRGGAGTELHACSCDEVTFLVLPSAAAVCVGQWQ